MPAGDLYLQKKGYRKWMLLLWMAGSLEAGAVAGVRNVRNPIELAAEVMLIATMFF